VKYPKIQTIFMRDEHKRIIVGEFSDPAFKAICLWRFGEKIDGTNVRIDWDGAGQVQIDGRTDDADFPEDLEAMLAQTFTPELLARQFKKNKVKLFGEGFGPGINKHGEQYGDEPRFALFDVVFFGRPDVPALWARQPVVQVIADEMGIEHAPEIQIANAEWGLQAVQDGLKSRIAKYDREMEGLVARPVPELFQQNGKPVIWKIKARDYRMLVAP